MSVSSSLGRRVSASFITCLLALVGASSVHAAVSKTEAACAKSLSKGAGKVASTTIKAIASCRAADLSGKAVGSCPDATSQEKIAGAIAKAEKLAAARCKSVCSLSSDVVCIADSLCPPKVTVSSGIAETCSAGASAIYFDLRKLGFPGAACDAKLGHDIVEASDIGECAGVVARDAGQDLADAIYGSLANASNVSDDAQACLSAISKAAQKLSKTIVKDVSACRNAILGGASGDPQACIASDPKTVGDMATFEAQLDSAIDASCGVSVLSEIDVCGNGVGQTMSIADLKTCIKAAVRETADTNTAPVLRQYSTYSIIDAAYPARPRCGDDRINQSPTAQLLLGEECDGTDDDACPGACLPPGDVFECTCGDRPRMRLFASHALTDADAGWSGISHQQGVADLSGYITELSDCDCDAFDGPTCTGSSTDPICTVTGFQKPSCSWEPFSGTRCDARDGTPNDIDEDKDCWVCDSWSANSGANCNDERDCDAKCYDAAGTPHASCDKQADCAEGEVCRGQCDRTQTCSIIPNGAPLPVAAAGATVCAVQRFRTDVTGTRNLITAEHEYNYRLFSIIHLGEASTRPCPVCGGFCVGGSRDLEICEGRCSATSTTSCRFDSDCPGGETCSKTSPECPGGFCQLDLICGANPGSPLNTAGKPCYIEYEHPYFGTMSNDCLPNPGVNITGQGFQIDYLPATSGATTLPAIYPCTAAGFENYLCPCPGVGGEPTKPNSCAPACNAAPNFGVGCGTGNNSSGQGSTCVGGDKNGKLCKTAGDCPSGTCTNPKHCIGDLAFERVSCTNDGQCGAGTCQDACPAGACVPLCVPSVSDTFEGICAAGPLVPKCQGGRFSYVNCSFAGAVNGTCSATCSGNNAACDSILDCPSGQTCEGACPVATDCEAGENGILGDGDDLVGAGHCELLDRSCYLEPLDAVGGSTVNGQADPENDYTVGLFCYTATTNGGVNGTSGFPGPGRVRQHGVNITNGFSAIP